MALIVIMYILYGMLETFVVFNLIVGCSSIHMGIVLELCCFDSPPPCIAFLDLWIQFSWSNTLKWYYAPSIFVDSHDLLLFDFDQTHTLLVLGVWLHSTMSIKNVWSVHQNINIEYCFWICIQGPELWDIFTVPLFPLSNTIYPSFWYCYSIYHLGSFFLCFFLSDLSPLQLRGACGNQNLSSTLVRGRYQGLETSYSLSLCCITEGGEVFSSLLSYSRKGGCNQNPGYRIGSRL